MSKYLSRRSGMNSLPFIVTKNPEMMQIIGLSAFGCLVSTPLLSLFFLLLRTEQALVIAAIL